MLSSNMGMATASLRRLASRPGTRERGHREVRMKQLALMTSAIAALVVAAGSSLAAELPGSFPGVTIDAKLIGGQEYEPLYGRIAEWEKLTGAKVSIISKKNHFELDKEFKSDLAANSIKWCVGSNHTSFAPQYPNLYTDLTKLIPKEEID